jgi:hypothetical protein
MHGTAVSGYDCLQLTGIRPGNFHRQLHIASQINHYRVQEGDAVMRSGRRRHNKETIKPSLKGVSETGMSFEQWMWWALRSQPSDSVV